MDEQMSNAQSLDQDRRSTSIEDERARQKHEAVQRLLWREGLDPWLIERTTLLYWIRSEKTAAEIAAILLGREGWMSHKLYLGDGVFVEVGLSGFVRLTTTNGFAVTNEIFLEEPVMEALLAWYRRLMGEPQDVRQ